MMLNSLLQSSSSVEHQAHPFVPHPQHYYQNDFWVESASAAGNRNGTIFNLASPTTMYTPLPSTLPVMITSSSNSSSTLSSVSPSDQQKVVPNAFYGSLLNQIHLRAGSTETSSYEAMNRHYQQQIEHHGSGFSLAGPNHDENPFHRLAEAIVATAKPSTQNYHHRSQSVIQNNKSCGHKSSEVSPTGLLFSKHPRQPFPSLSQPNESIFDRRSKRPLTSSELERKRDLANKQERRRMHRLNDALNRLREVCFCFVL